MSPADHRGGAIGTMRHAAHSRTCQIALATVAALLPLTLALADQTVSVIQQGRAFNIGEITINHGDVINFLNQDDFDHQIYVASPAFTFESDESPPGQSVQVRFPAAGRFEVRCHIHPKMKLVVTVN